MNSNDIGSTSRARLRLRSLFLMCAACVSVAACGGGGSDDGNADTASDAPAPATGGGAAPPPPASAPAAPAPTPPAPTPTPPAPAPAPAPGSAPAPPAPSPAAGRVDGAPVAGNPAGACAVPAAAQAKSVAQPTTVVGTGTPASCTSAAVVAAVANGGVVTFNCGADPVTITMAATARVFNDKPDLVLDGGGKVTLSGGGARRILYQNTCDQSLVWTSAQCNTQDNPKTTLQNITFTDGNSSGQSYGLQEIYGGGAVFARGGRLSIVNSRFFRNQCESSGPDVGGAAVRALETSRASPVYVVNSTFGGADGWGNVCSNGGGLSSIDVSYAVINSVFTHNKAIGVGQNPAIAGTPGGGLGGGIYMDGNTFDLSMCGTVMRNNSANESGSAIIYVSNSRTGTMSVRDSSMSANRSIGTAAPSFDLPGLPGLFVLAAPGQPVISGSSITP